MLSARAARLPAARIETVEALRRLPADRIETVEALREASRRPD